MCLTEDNLPDPRVVNCSTKEKQRFAEGNPPTVSLHGQGSVVPPFPTLATGTVASSKSLWDTFTASPMFMQVLRGEAPRTLGRDRISAARDKGCWLQAAPLDNTELTSMLSSERSLWERPLISPELEQSPGPQLFWGFLRGGGYGLGPHSRLRQEYRKCPTLVPCPNPCIPWIAP